MPLILPNTIQNAIPADGDKLGQNFNAITSWANQEAISRDGSTAMQAPLLLPGVPTQTNQAATKGYVDSNVPVGVMWQFLGTAAPTNWMLCQGQALSRATYAALFAVLGTTYGAGDGSTTFNIPSMQGRSPMGHYPGGGWAATFGQQIGSQDATLPSHTHGVNIWSGLQNADHAHSFNVNTNNAGYHGHGVAHGASLVAVFGSGISAGTGGSQWQTYQFVNDGDHAHNVSGGTSGVNANHAHAINGTSDPAGSSASNANIPPVVVVNFIVKVL